MINLTGQKILEFQTDVRKHILTETEKGESGDSAVLEIDHRNSKVCNKLVQHLLQRKCTPIDIALRKLKHDERSTPPHQLIHTMLRNETLDFDQVFLKIRNPDPGIPPPFFVPTWIEHSQFSAGKHCILITASNMQ